MSGLTDIYVITDSRAKELILSFLRHYLITWAESADEYEIPQYSYEPEIILKTDLELMDYCEQNTTVVHTIYWKNKSDSFIKHGMVFYTSDQKMILGLSVLSGTKEKEYLKDLKCFLQSDLGYLTFEEPAPSNYPDFVEMVNNYNHLDFEV
ncbi:hypothetical protein EHQ30_06535 [Leptospira brenneri]|uniref:Uncharacterized protein n=1 Tax=Leptospira brenneri TaxID=2023182 RepID=A0A5F1Z9I7_9LEPT|nr:hypothetical protein [Leptospira brenneri]TGK96258.1 hypothetical protein EHQ30_06535 [Leptospira brenneri]